MSFGESIRTLAGDSHALVGFAIAAGIVLLLTPLVMRLAKEAAEIWREERAQS